MCLCTACCPLLNKLPWPGCGCHWLCRYQEHIFERKSLDSKLTQWRRKEKQSPFSLHRKAKQCRLQHYRNTGLTKLYLAKEPEKRWWHLMWTWENGKVFRQRRMHMMQAEQAIRKKQGYIWKMEHHCMKRLNKDVKRPLIIHHSSVNQTWVQRCRDTTMQSAPKVSSSHKYIPY